MYIRKAKCTDANDLKVLYFENLTQFPPKEEQDMNFNVRPFAVIENVVTHADYRNKGYASALLEKVSEIAREHRCYKAFLETGSNKESTLNFYKRNGFEIDKKHSCLKRLK